MALAETAELVVRLSLRDGLSSGIGGAVRSLNALDRATGNTQRALGRTWSNIQRGAVLASAAAVGGLTAVVRAAADFETAFAGVRKTVDEADLRAAGSSFERLSGQIREMAREIPVSADELARLGETAGALGVKADAIDEFIRVTALLGVTTNLSSEQAAESLGVLGNVLQFATQDYERFASALVALGNAGASTESDIVSIAERAGAAGRLIGVSTPAVLGLSSAVASLGIEAEAGGTALQKFFIDTAKQVAAADAELAILAKTAGTSGREFARAFDQDAGAALTRFLTGLGKLPQAQQLRILEDLGFNDARITRTLLGLANNTALLTSQLDLSAEAFAENTALSKEAAERFKTFDSQVQVLVNNLRDAGITIGTNLLPKLTPLIQEFTAFLQKPETQRVIAQFGTDLAKGFERFVTQVRNADFSPLIDGLRLTADVAKTAIGIFRSMPEDLQKLLIGAFAVNKLTGGLVTGIGKDLVGLFNKQFLGRGANPANPLFVWNVNPAAGGIPGAVGTGGGILAGGRNLLMAGARFVLPIAVGVLIAQAIKEATGTTDEEVLYRNTHGQFGPRSGSNLPTPIIERDRSIDVLPRRGARGTERPRNIDPFAPFSPGAQGLFDSAISRHGALADLFNTGGLSKFRADALGSGLFEERLDYLRGAQGRFTTDEKGQQFDAVISRDIAALKEQQQGASKADQAKLQTMIDILAAIRDKERFPTSEWTPVKQAMQEAAAAIRDKEIPAPQVTVNVATTFTPYNIERTTTTIRRYGRVVAV